MDSTAREDLAVIRQIMEETQREVVDRGKHFAIWGVVSTVGLVATYARVLGWVGVDARLVWAVLLVAGWCGSLWVGWRDGRRARVRTMGRRLLSGVWLAAAVTLTLLAAAGLFGGVLASSSLAGVLSVVLAVPILATSWLTGEGWLAWVAAGWWLGGGVMLFVPGVYALPLMAAMSLLLLAVPGWVLNARATRGRAAGSGSSEAVRDGG